MADNGGGWRTVPSRKDEEERRRAAQYAQKSDEHFYYVFENTRDNYEKFCEFKIKMKYPDVSVDTRTEAAEPDRNTGQPRTRYTIKITGPAVAVTSIKNALYCNPIKVDIPLSDKTYDFTRWFRKTGFTYPATMTRLYDKDRERVAIHAFVFPWEFGNLRKNEQLCADHNNVAEYHDRAADFLKRSIREYLDGNEDTQQLFRTSGAPLVQAKASNEGRAAQAAVAAANGDADTYSRRRINHHDAAAGLTDSQGLQLRIRNALKAVSTLPHVEAAKQLKDLVDEIAASNLPKADELRFLSFLYECEKYFVLSSLSRHEMRDVNVTIVNSLRDVLAVSPSQKQLNDEDFLFQPFTDRRPSVSVDDNIIIRVKAVPPNVLDDEGLPVDPVSEQEWSRLGTFCISRTICHVFPTRVWFHVEHVEQMAGREEGAEAADEDHSAGNLPRQPGRGGRGGDGRARGRGGRGGHNNNIIDKDETPIEPEPNQKHLLLALARRRVIVDVKFDSKRFVGLIASLQRALQEGAESFQRVVKPQLAERGVVSSAHSNERFDMDAWTEECRARREQRRPVVDDDDAESPLSDGGRGGRGRGRGKLRAERGGLLGGEERRHDDLTVRVCDNLDDEQYAAVAFLLAGRCRSLVLTGPAGTGKTEVVSRALLALFGRSQSATFLLVSPSNAACDALADRVIKTALQFQQQTVLDAFVRFYKTSRHPMNAPPTVLPFANIAERKRELCAISFGDRFDETLLSDDEFMKGKRIIACVTSALPLLEKKCPGFLELCTHVFVDEAAQAQLAHGLAVLNHVPRDVTLTLLGDPEQIRPQCHAPFCRQWLRDKSLLSYAMSRRNSNEEGGKKPHQPQPTAVTGSFPTLLLRTSHRFSAAMGQFLSAMFYQGKLRCAEHGTTDEGIEVSAEFANWPGHHGNCRAVRFVHCGAKEALKTTGVEAAAGNTASAGIVYNPEEAKQVVAYYASLRRVARVPPNEIKILCQYEYQRRKIISELAMLGFGKEDVNVRPLEEVHGAEADVILVSLVRSDPKLKSAELPDRNEINTTASRARLACIWFGTGETVQRFSKKWSTLIDKLVEDRAVDGFDYATKKFDASKFVKLALASNLDAVKEFVPASEHRRVHKVITYDEIKSKRAKGIFIGTVVPSSIRSPTAATKHHALVVRNRFRCAQDMVISTDATSGRVESWIFPGDTVALVVDPPRFWRPAEAMLRLEDDYVTRTGDHNILTGGVVDFHRMPELGMDPRDHDDEDTLDALCERVDTGSGNNDAAVFFSAEKQPTGTVACTIPLPTMCTPFIIVRLPINITADAHATPMNPFYKPMPLYDARTTHDQVRQVRMMHPGDYALWAWARLVRDADGPRLLTACVFPAFDPGAVLVHPPPMVMNPPMTFGPTMGGHDSQNSNTAAFFPRPDYPNVVSGDVFFSVMEGASPQEVRLETSFSCQRAMVGDRNGGYVARGNAMYAPFDVQIHVPYCADWLNTRTPRDAVLPHRARPVCTLPPPGAPPFDVNPDNLEAVAYWLVRGRAVDITSASATDPNVGQTNVLDNEDGTLDWPSLPPTPHAIKARRAARPLITPQKPHPHERVLTLSATILVLLPTARPDAPPRATGAAADEDEDGSAAAVAPPTIVEACRVTPQWRLPWLHESRMQPDFAAAADASMRYLMFVGKSALEGSDDTHPHVGYTNQVLRDPSSQTRSWLYRRLRRTLCRVVGDHIAARVQLDAFPQRALLVRRFYSNLQPLKLDPLEQWYVPGDTALRATHAASSRQCAVMARVCEGPISYGHILTQRLLFAASKVLRAPNSLTPAEQLLLQTVRLHAKRLNAAEWTYYWQ